MWETCAGLFAGGEGLLFVLAGHCQSLSWRRAPTTSLEVGVPLSLLVHTLESLWRSSWRALGSSGGAGSPPLQRGGVSLSLAGSNTTKEAGMTEKSQLPDVIPEEIAGTSQSLLGESGGNLLNLSYINQSNTCTSQEVETMPSAELLGSSWDLESNS